MENTLCLIWPFLSLAHLSIFLFLSTIFLERMFILLIFINTFFFLITEARHTQSRNDWKVQNYVI